MDEDLNSIFQKLNEMMSDKETSDNLKDILNNFSSSSNNSSQASSNNSENNASNSSKSSSSIPEFDIGTILKIKAAIDRLNSSQSDSRSNLLKSLKPYLHNSKKEKIDQYIKFLKIADVLESLNFLKEGIFTTLIMIFLFPKKKDEFFLGRGHEATFKVSDISISRVHCRIYLNDNGKISLDDLGSKFGTLILLRDDTEVDEIIRKKMKIQIGRSVLWIGDKNDEWKDVFIHLLKMK